MLFEEKIVFLHSNIIQKSVMTYTVFLNLEPYLAQWLQHESGGEYPIKLKRGSAEADILECFLKPQPKEEGYVPQLRP